MDDSDRPCNKPGCEFIGPFSDAEKQHITEAIEKRSGSGKALGGPTWTVFCQQVGGRRIYLAANNYAHRSYHGNSVEALVEAVEREP